MTARQHLAPHALPRPTGRLSPGRRLADLVVLIRLPSCLAGGVSVLLGIHLTAGNTGPPVLSAVLAMLSMFFAVAAANAINDVLDLDTDALAKPGRPLPAGRISNQAALGVAACAAALAVVAAGLLGGYALLWAIVLLVLAFWYSYRAKGTVLLGNCIVACCASSPILFGSLVTRRADVLAWTAAGLSFAFMLAYETLKTIADRESDKVCRIRTFATEAGIHAAVLLFRALIALLVLAAGAASVASPHPVPYLLALAITFVSPALTAVVTLGSSPRPEAIRVSVFFMRSAWFLGIIALWLLR
ncbi:MAG: UbiA family prenyltransferase [Streptosporangiaceae bacterium]